MTDIVEFINNEELTDILMNAIPEMYKNTGEWEFTINYKDKKIDTLELWKNKYRFKKDIYVLDLTTIYNEYQLKQLFLNEYTEC